MKKRPNKALEWRFGRPQSKPAGVVLLMCVFVVLCLYWQQVGVFTKPTYILETLVGDAGRILLALKVSTKYVLFGVMFGGVLGTFVGLVCGAWSRYSVTLYWLSAMTISFPKTAMFFVFVGYYGVLNQSSLYAMTFYSVFVFMLFMTLGLMRAQAEEVSSSRMEVAVQLFATRFEVVYHGILPKILPTLFSMWAYTSIGLWPSLIFYEPNGAPTSQGIGNYIYGAYQSGWWDQFFAGSIVLMIPGAATALALLLLGHLLKRTQ